MSFVDDGTVITITVIGASVTFDVIVKGEDDE